VKSEKGEVTHPDYPEEWYRMVAAAAGDKLTVNKVAIERAAEEEEKKEALQVAEAILTLLRSRGVAVDDASRKKILETDKRNDLDAWLVRAATANSVTEVLEAP
jgi:hypothetical protein